MFAAHTAATTSDSSADQSWMKSMTSQEVLDYTSFSDDSHSPVLSLQSFSSQHSPDLDAYSFQDFEPLATPASAPMLALSSNSPVTLSNGSSSAETAHQAALLHAYLMAQDKAYRAQLEVQQQQQQCDFSALAQLEKVQKQQQGQEATTDSVQTQKTDAENLARYLALMREVKEESSSEGHAGQPEEMALHCPSSPSSTSSIMAERSPSPEASLDAQASDKPTNSIKSSRQLICYNCKVTKTPLWRRTPDRMHSLCNACGLYQKQYGAHRPLNVRSKLPSVLVDPRLNAMPYGRSTQGTRGSSPSGPESSSSTDSESDSGRSPRDEEMGLLPDLTKMYADALLRPSVKKTTPPLMTAKQGIECANCSQTQTPLWRKNEAGEPICNACGLYARLHNRARPVTMRKSKITRRRRDWGGNLAHQAKAQAQALAMFHAQIQAQVEAQRGSSCESMQESSSLIESSMVEEMSRRALDLNGRTSIPKSPVHSSDSEEEQQQPKQMQQPANNPAQKLSGNLIMDEHKFSDMVGQMNAHQMNRFLSILESRCGVLRNRILSSTEGSAQDSSLDNLF
ncbi:hypothetical protein EDD21DRAFT_391532 [Dissophora ornata]|nr:hypothetical protein BGZ58_004001 [Dissophora ornata]KAI8595304.1 hypothetical protein EDD21DRAFT_391532 [Dissophora ornata]